MIDWVLGLFKKPYLIHAQPNSRAWTLDELSRMSYENRLDYRIIPVGRKSRSVWFSAFPREKSKIFSVEDVNSFWLIVESKAQLKKAK